MHDGDNAARLEDVASDPPTAPHLQGTDAPLPPLAYALDADMQTTDNERLQNFLLQDFWTARAVALVGDVHGRRWWW